MKKNEKDRLGERLDEYEIEEFKKANRYLNMAHMDAKMMGYDIVDRGHWSIAQAIYFSAVQAETNNELLVELVDNQKATLDVLQNISMKLSDIAFKSS